MPADNHFARLIGLGEAGDTEGTTDSKTDSANAGTADQPEILGDEEIYEGRIVNLSLMELRMPGGAVVRREVVHHAQSVGVLPIADDGRFIFVRQYRPPARAFLLELPAGSVEDGESPEQCARRELTEEIGMRPGSIQRVAGFYLAPGWATEFMHVYIAEDLVPESAQGDEDEDIELVYLAPAEALAGMRDGTIQDCKSVALLGLYFAEQRERPGAGQTLTSARQDPWANDNPDEI
jgi:ADP-ribose pyrophosphatase